jgi:hypothetical protein
MEMTDNGNDPDAERPSEPIRLDYQKPVNVFPTNWRDRIIFWGCFSVIVFMLGIAVAIGFWALLQR